MDITFTVKIAEEGIPQLMGLLAKMWDNPNPTAQVRVERSDEGKTVTANPETPAAPAAAPEPVAAPEAVVTSETYTVEAIGRASAAFVDADPANMDKLLAALQAMGVQAVTQLPDAAARAEFARRMLALGAKFQ